MIVFTIFHFVYTQDCININYLPNSFSIPNPMLYKPNILKARCRIPPCRIIGMNKRHQSPSKMRSVLLAPTIVNYLFFLPKLSNTLAVGPKVGFSWKGWICQLFSEISASIIQQHMINMKRQKKGFCWLPWMQSALVTMPISLCMSVVSELVLKQF